ncbi:Phage-related baseplate assembly protein [Planctomycetes bacterium Pan216]|uniref:Phage-related baseplate assembly protein n=1 Tax=Kolteria novifilia TaxID=2527975 RepID=A0A518B4Q1_9BACT|nr:Phage-related baseplate assembly protein [Planctomycetes bacterium Pan216]
MNTYSQKNRPMVLSTPLGPDVLLLTAFRGREAISELFRFELDVVVERSTEIDFARLLAQPVSVSFTQEVNGFEAKRYFHGIVSEIAETSGDDLFTHYSLEVVPKLWLQSRNQRYRIFQQKSVPEILAAVLSKLSPRFQLSETYEPRNYTTQFRESDFAFISRLMEEEGIHYHFEHSEDNHLLVIGDTSSNATATAEDSSIRFDPTEGGARPERRISRWHKRQRVMPPRVSLRDYSPDLPNDLLEASVPAPSTIKIGSVSHRFDVNKDDALQIEEFPGGFAHFVDSTGPMGQDYSGDVQRLFQLNQRVASLRMQEHAVRGIDLEGAGDHGGLMPGYTFDLKGHPNADGSYLIRSVEHSIRMPGYLAEPEDRGGESYANRFSCMPLELPFRPIKRHPKPSVSGPHTAKVVTPKGEEIFTDPSGRVKVHFHWDREGANDGGDSCWVRFAQSWAGKGYGMMTIPRAGQEVVVNFLDGDPDRPLIVGSVYNAEQSPPLNLPNEKSSLAIKSQTYRGKPGDFHGIKLDDSTNSEMMQLRSQLDLVLEAKRHQTQTVPGTRQDVIGTDEFRFVGGLPGSSHSPDPRAGSGGNGSNDSGSGGDSKNSPPSPPPPPPPHWQEGLSTELFPAFSLAQTSGLSSATKVGSYKSYTVGSKFFGGLDLLGVVGFFPSAAPVVSALSGAGLGINTGQYGLTQGVKWGPNYEFGLGGDKYTLEHLGEDPTTLTLVKAFASLHIALILGRTSLYYFMTIKDEVNLNSLKHAWIGASIAETSVYGLFCGVLAYMAKVKEAKKAVDEVADSVSNASEAATNLEVSGVLNEVNLGLDEAVDGVSQLNPMSEVGNVERTAKSRTISTTEKLSLTSEDTCTLSADNNTFIRGNKSVNITAVDEKASIRLDSSGATISASKLRLQTSPLTYIELNELDQSITLSTVGGSLRLAPTGTYLTNTSETISLIGTTTTISSGMGTAKTIFSGGTIVNSATAMTTTASSFNLKTAMFTTVQG